MRAELESWIVFVAESVDIDSAGPCNRRFSLRES